MEGAFETAPSYSAASADARSLQVWQRPIPSATVALAIAAMSGFAVWALARPEPDVSRVERFAIPPPAPETVGVSFRRRDIAIFPYGSKVVYTGTGGNPFQLYVRPVDAVTAIPLQGLNTEVFGPFISPDSAWVGFYDNADGTLRKVSILGGPPVAICDLGGESLGASWSEDDTIIFGTQALSGLWQVSANGGEAVELTAPDEGVNHAWPDVLPGGRAVLFTILSAPGAIERAQIAVLNLDTGEQRLLFSEGSAPRYSPTGHIVYGIGGTLRAVGFDLDRLEVTNPTPTPVLDGVITKPRGAANFDLSRDGSLAYVAGEGRGVGIERTLVWVDRQGNEVPLDLPSGGYQWPRVSPDGTRMVMTVQDPDNIDVWVSTVDRGTLSKLTTDPALDASGLWTLDGDRVVFASQREGIKRDGYQNQTSWGLFWVAADGSGEVEHLMTNDDAQLIRPYGWTPDGSALVFDYVVHEMRTNIGVLSMEGDRTWEPLIATDADEEAPAVSPDGQWIAYTSG